MEGSLVAYKVFTNGSVLNASEINDNLMNQSVMVFSNSTARDAALTSPVEGMLTWLEDVNRYESYNGTAWVVLGNSGLELIKTETVGTAVSTVTVTNAFSADYDNYKIIVTGGTASTSGNLTLRIGAAAADYRSSLASVTYSTGSQSITVENGAASWANAGSFTPTTKTMNIDLFDPFNTNAKRFTGSYVSGVASGTTNGFLNNSTSYTALTIAPSTGTLTGGTIYVYGYRKN
jgi:hypothetical protein